MMATDLCLWWLANTQRPGQGPSGGLPPSSWPAAWGPPMWPYPIAWTALPAGASSWHGSAAAETPSCHAKWLLVT